MDAKVASCNFTKYIKRGPNRWQHCPVVRGKTGRVKQDLVLVDGRIEHHPEGYYSFDWREGGRRHRRALGKDAPAAQLALERHIATERARAIGIPFRVSPQQPGSAFLSRGKRDLDQIFSLQFERTVNRDNTVQFQNLNLQIERVRWKASLAGCSVTVHQHLDGTLSLRYGPQQLGRYSS